MIAKGVFLSCIAVIICSILVRWKYGYIDETSHPRGNHLIGCRESCLVRVVIVLCLVDYKHIKQ